MLARPEAGAIAGMVAVMIIFTVLSPHFLTEGTARSVANLVAEIAIVAAGVTLLAIGGEFDLSIGSALAVSSIVFTLVVNGGADPAIGLIAALGFAMTIGLINGLIVVRLGVSSFIATLGTLLFWRGVVFALSSGFAVSADSGLVKVLFSGTLPGGFNISFLWLILVIAALSLLLYRTTFGNWIFATGGNVGAARAMGVPTDRVKILLFMNSSFLAGLVGIIQVGRFAGVDPLRGDGLELTAIAAMVIGGTALTGGYGTVIGTLIGALMLMVTQTGLVLVGASPYYFRTFIGVIVVAAVVLNLRVQRAARERA